VNSLAVRKQALVAESELHRQILTTEIQNLKLSGERVRRNFRFLRLLKPVLLLAPVVAGSIIGFRSAQKQKEGTQRLRSGWRRLFGAAMFGWRLYRRAAPIIAQLRSRRDSKSEAGRRATW
jgi:hypothetical protein